MFPLVLYDLNLDRQARTTAAWTIASPAVEAIGYPEVLGLASFEVGAPSVYAYYLRFPLTVLIPPSFTYVEFFE